VGESLRRLFSFWLWKLGWEATVKLWWLAESFVGQEEENFVSS